MSQKISKKAFLAVFIAPRTKTDRAATMDLHLHKFVAGDGQHRHRFCEDNCWMVIALAKPGKFGR